MQLFFDRISIGRPNKISHKYLMDQQFDVYFVFYLITQTDTSTRLEAAGREEARHFPFSPE